MIIILSRVGKTRFGPFTALAWLLAAGLVAAACSGDQTESGQAGARVIATTTMLGDLTRNVVGDEGSVEVLLPVGVDPHDYQASARQVAAIQEADLIVANGMGLEEGLEDALDGAERDGVRVLYLGEQLEPLPFAAEGGNSDHGAYDPHVWLDPIRMAEAARILGDELEEVASGGTWTDRAEDYAVMLTDLDTEIRTMFSSIPAERRKLVSNHTALGYFAARYDFDVIGAVIPGGSTLGEPSSAELAKLVEVMERDGISVVFAENTEPSALAEAVATEVGNGVDVVELYTGSLGEPGSDADTLIGMLRANANLIAEALS